MEVLSIEVFVEVRVADVQFVGGYADDWAFCDMSVNEDMKKRASATIFIMQL